MIRLRLLVAVSLIAVACGSSTDPAGTDAAVTDSTASGSTASVTATPVAPPPSSSVPLEDAEPAESIVPAELQPCADVIDASAQPTGDATWRITATVRSGDTGWDKYADEWAVHGDGVLLGTRVLTHPHETEQPFTRSLDGVIIPSDVVEVEVSARDSVNGFCGESFVVTLER